MKVKKVLKENLPFELKMRNFYTVVSVFLILSAFFSCENGDEMGHSVLPGSDYASIIVTDTVEVDAFTEYDTAVYAAYKNFMTAGVFSDPVFGRTETSFAAKFSNTSYGKYTENAIADSVVLTLSLDTTMQRFYGDSLSMVKLYVFPVIKVMEPTAVYYQNMDFEEYYDKTPLGVVEFVPSDIKDSLTIRLDKSYGDKIIKAAADTAFDSDICGLYFKTDASDGLNTVLRFYFNTRTSDFSYYVYYHEDGTETVKSVYYSVSDTDIRIDLARHDYSGTPLESLDGKSVDDYAYLQGLTGTKIRLEFPNIENLNSQEPGKYFSLLRAQLIVPLAEDDVSAADKYAAIPYVCCAGCTSDGTVFNFAELYDFDSYGRRTEYYHTYALDYENRCYSVNLTGRIQNLLDLYASGDTPAYSIYLYPSNRVSDFSRSVVSTRKNSENPMRLVVEYLTYER